MKFRKFILCLVILVTSIVNVGLDFNEYCNLKKEEVPLIKKEDLPEEFSDEAYDTIVEFIKKTRNLKNEWLIYFDYVSGEILKCVKGGGDNVNVNFKENEFDGCHVASIHNHPKHVLSPPSSKNFRILAREFEDYELISGFENFWILKAKGVYENLIGEMNKVSDSAFKLSLLFCSNRYNDEEIIDKMHDVRYGAELLRYINNKNITDIQLIKKEYVL